MDSYIKMYKLQDIKAEKKTSTSAKTTLELTFPKDSYYNKKVFSEVQTSDVPQPGGKVIRWSNK